MLDHELQARLAELVRTHARIEPSEAAATAAPITAGNGGTVLIGSHNRVTINSHCPLFPALLKLLSVEPSAI